MSKEKMSEDMQAELSACKHFLSTKVGMSKVAIECLEAIPEILISTAKGAKEVLDSQNICNQLHDASIDEKDLAGKAEGLLEGELISDLQPSVNAMLQTGTGSVSKSITLPCNNGMESITFSVKAINLGYESDEAQKLARKDQGIPSKLKKFAEGNWSKLTKLAIIKRGTKTAGSFTLARIAPPLVEGKMPKEGVTYNVVVDLNSKAE